MCSFAPFVIPILVGGILFWITFYNWSGKSDVTLQEKASYKLPLFEITSAATQCPEQKTPSCDVGTSVLNAVDRKSLFPAIAKALPHLNMDDPELIAIIKQYVLEPPSPRSALSLNGPSKKYFSEFRQDQTVDKLLKHINNGFFIEVGAYDGESFSNSLFFEREKNWTGLLIEPLPDQYRDLQGKHRHAYITNACLGTKQTAYAATFQTKDMLSVIANDANPNQQGMIEVLCVPLYTLLKAIGLKRVDYFTLDIESLEIELAVLKSLPWGEVEFGVIDVEHNKDYKNLEVLRQFMDEKGFIEVVLEYVDSFFLNKSLASPDMPRRRKMVDIIGP